MPQPLLVWAAMACACEAQTETVAFGLMLPSDALRFESTDNVSIVLEPDGFVDTVRTDGLDFEFSVELEPDGTVRTLAIYLAHGETLLGWGRSAPFTYASAADAGFQVLVGEPDRLVPIALGAQRPNPRAAVASGYGLVAVGSDGDTLFLDERTFELRGAAPLRSEVADAPGALVSDALGGVQRIAWGEALTVDRFDVAENAWARLAPPDADAHGQRTGAAWLVGSQRQAMRIFGGGEHADVLELALVPTGDEEAVRVVAELDAPRPGSTAVETGTAEAPRALLFGGSSEGLPLVYDVAGRRAAGPAGTWVGAACLLPPVPEDAPASVLCFGGIRDGSVTADAAHITLGDPLEVNVLRDWLPLAVAEPLVFRSTDGAFYAQGEGHWLRVDARALSVEDTGTTHARLRGGTSVTLRTGATLVLGAVDADDQPLPQWHLFVPHVM